MIDHVELTYRDNNVTATCRSGGVTTVGLARPSNARWEITVDGVTREGFAGGPDDTEESVREQIVWWLVARDADPVVPYKGYQIRPRPHQRDANAWTIDGQIWKDHGSEVDAQPFSAKNHFSTREEAVLQSVRFGQRAIDGEVPGVTVANL